MCFSAEASLASGLLLIPVGTYCVADASRKNRAYWAISASPLLFGIQQLSEAGVWHGLEHGNPAVVKVASLIFLFFAIAFWPAWVPFSGAVMESRPGRRKFFALLGTIGLVVGCSAYGAVAVRYDEWLDVEIRGHSIRYDLSRLPDAQTAIGVAWQAFYMAAVALPLVMSRDRQLRILGASIVVAAIVTQIVFLWAFVSVWCFFAAWLSLHIWYVVYRLPLDRPRTHRNRAD